MKYNDYKEIIRTVPDFPIPGVQYRDITSILEQPDAFKGILTNMFFHTHRHKADVIVGIESRGFIFGTPIAQELRLPFIPARKPGKLPNKTVSKKFKLEYGEAEIHLQLLSPIEGRVTIVDDLIATGGTALACADLVHENFNIPKQDIQIMAVIDLPDLGGSAIIRDAGYKVETLIEYEGD